MSTDRPTPDPSSDRTSPREDPVAQLRSRLQPIVARVAALHPQACTDPTAAEALARRLMTEFPFDGPEVRAVHQQVRRGIGEGWLCDRGEPSARYCRIAKATPQTHDLSIDIVALQGTALAHTHPCGEVTMAWAGEEPGAEDARFDGHPPGWVVAHAGSSHTPTVTGSTMHLLYFLPGGQVQWHPA